MSDDLTPRPSNSNISTFIFQLENELNIRDDFIDLYENILQNADKSIRDSYLTVDNSFFYNAIDNAQKYVTNFGVTKNLKRYQGSVESLSFFGNIFGLVDSVITIVMMLGVIITTGTIIAGISPIITIISATLTIGLGIVGTIFWVISKSEKIVKEILMRLIINRSSLKSINRTRFSKNRLMSVYIWDHTLCTNTSGTIRGFMILLLVKSLSKNIFFRIKSKLLKVTPLYMKNHNEDYHKLKFFLYAIKESFGR